MKFMLLALIFLCSSCSSPPPSLPPWQDIAGRDRRAQTPIYRVRVPHDWQRHEPSPTTDLADTTQAIACFTIQDGDQHIDIAIHNFPSDTLEQRIPPSAQVARWQRQLAKTSEAVIVIRPIAHGGFSGLEFTAPGIMAWSLQLTPEHYRSLSRPPDTPLQRQMRADYTIKATGPSQMVSQYAQEIEGFARSFELIEEIPAEQ